ncbi:uncharacterized protein LY79DRAFT_9300 [Colletotrichum navitas]|uniref:Uncharacterized protein n=1 Tax=Colletotrichum navitas TaxID=681940 RepID=A0AAD8VD27_9PEZI|nr:uncharacterized protein LY79DRAFT_9300 [Colletotrichum navitas]KAK1600155.1 hypothetical protein LY79DRAFT_9300 [Colletotrichum navitas]
MRPPPSVASYMTKSSGYWSRLFGQPGTCRAQKVDRSRKSESVGSSPRAGVRSFVRSSKGQRTDELLTPQVRMVPYSPLVIVFPPPIASPRRHSVARRTSSRLSSSLFPTPAQRNIPPRRNARGDRPRRWCIPQRKDENVGEGQDPQHQVLCPCKGPGGSKRWCLLVLHGCEGSCGGYPPNTHTYYVHTHSLSILSFCIPLLSLPDTYTRQDSWHCQRSCAARLLRRRTTPVASPSLLPSYQFAPSRVRRARDRRRRRETWADGVETNNSSRACISIMARRLHQSQLGKYPLASHCVSSTRLTLTHTHTHTYTGGTAQSSSVPFQKGSRQFRDAREISILSE